jgi:uracil-DNA glycosylase
MDSFAKLLSEVRACTACSQHLPRGPRPVLQAHEAARILIAGQAPGRKVHESGIPFDDASGLRLRSWLGVDHQTFYDATQIAIVPMAFCYPGQGQSGDLPPRAECAPLWRESLLKPLTQLQLTVVVGQYAQAHHLPDEASLTDAVRSWRRHWPRVIALPHPSPRNNVWLKRHPWFEEEVVPALQQRVREVLGR